MSDLRNVFVVKNIRATNVNLIMNDFAAGLPSPVVLSGACGPSGPEISA